MTTQSFLQLDLVLHITGFTVMAGIILADFIINRRVSRFLLTDKPRAASIMESTAVFPRLIGIGAGVLILTGIGMVIAYKGVIAQMLWFKIKMAAVLLIILNGSIVLRRNGSRLRALLQTNDERNNGDILLLKQRLSVFYGLELLLILIIFILSVFKF